MKFDEYEMTFVYTRYFHETTFLPLGVIIRHSRDCNNYVYFLGSNCLAN